MAYIRTVHESDADGKLGRLYSKFANPDGTVDDVLRVHSLNLESLEAHCALYIQSCHRPGPLSRVSREIVAVTVSRLNKCVYCMTHHGRGLDRLLGGDRAGLVDGLLVGDESGLTDAERAMTWYAGKLALEPSSIGQEDVDALREHGFDDRVVLDLVQIVSYFSYANRIVLGLGARLEDG